ncbi:hypothetical protein Glove_318g38 [Diversispora epigaea]|uniref:TLDc domain-containing protein n=1 Tax=Diversispora epigaea TaxID=1348612 RepID=A0A397HQV0_9GLOM|nr:hypothetical protein Glove_318g38 [Diversispora epigaea]
MPTDILYFHLSTDEVLDSIKTYKKILEKQLWEDINHLKSSILPARSVLVIEIPSRTIVVAKVKGTDEIIGGYNPLTWDNSNTITGKWILQKVSRKVGPYFGDKFSFKSNLNFDGVSYCYGTYKIYEKSIKA